MVKDDIHWYSLMIYFKKRKMFRARGENYSSSDYFQFIGYNK